jgi:MFS family permease
MTSPTVPAPSTNGAYAAFRFPNFRKYVLARLFLMASGQMQSVAIGWYLYERTNSAMALALVGAVQMLPILFLSIPAGQLADRFSRKTIILTCQSCGIFFSIGLGLLALLHGPTWLLYTLLLGHGIARSFSFPAMASLLPAMVPREAFMNAVTWNSTSFETAAMVGPALAGMIMGYAHGAHVVFFINSFAILTSVLLFAGVKVPRGLYKPVPLTRSEFLGGLRFVWNTKVVLAAMVLDTFAVMLGGALALLPIYAKDILQVGAEGLGWLRAAPSLGAVLTAIFVVHSGPFRHAGKALLYSMIGFGIATIIFGLSKSFWLSMFALLMVGSCDNISVVIRHTLLQMAAPDELRGRVSSVNDFLRGFRRYRHFTRRGRSCMEVARAGANEIRQRTTGGGD